jgi:hypothetical protein
MSEVSKYYTVSKRLIYISSRASYAAIDRYDKFAYFNLDREVYITIDWVPGAMNQHGEVINPSLFLEDALSPAKGFARFSDYAILGLSGATAIVFLAGVPILVVLIGIIIG